MKPNIQPLCPSQRTSHPLSWSAAVLHMHLPFASLCINQPFVRHTSMQALCFPRLHLTRVTPNASTVVIAVAVQLCVLCALHALRAVGGPTAGLRRWLTQQHLHVVRGMG